MVANPNMPDFPVAVYWEKRSHVKHVGSFAEALGLFNKYSKLFSLSEHGYLAFDTDSMIAVVTNGDALWRGLQGLDARDKTASFNLIQRFAVDFAGGFNDDALVGGVKV